MDIKYPTEQQPNYQQPGKPEIQIPEFANIEEENEWRFEMIAKTATNLAERIAGMEQMLGRGADMIQYKIPGDDKHSNLTQLFDTLFGRLNTLEQRIDQLASVHPRDGQELQEPD